MPLNLTKHVAIKCGVYSIHFSSKHFKKNVIAVMSINVFWCQLPCVKYQGMQGNGSFMGLEFFQKKQPTPSNNTQYGALKWVDGPLIAQLHAECQTSVVTISPTRADSVIVIRWCVCAAPARQPAPTSQTCKVNRMKLYWDGQ